jgi:hypothetical protein
VEQMQHWLSMIFVSLSMHTATSHASQTGDRTK